MPLTGCARALLLALAASLACAGAASAAEKGVATDLTWGLSQETAATEATLIADLGAQWVALDFNWRDGEPSDGTYAATEFDRLTQAIALARAAGARVLLMVSETPQWASGQSDTRYPPTDPAKLAELYAELVDRFGQTVDAWQVWNEPNHPDFWQPDPTTDPDACAAYAAMLKAVAPVIRAGDPTARVLFAGLAWNDYAYLERCLALAPDLPDSFDVMVTHPYALAAAAPETQSDVAPQDGRLDYQTFLAYREIRRVLDKPIWFSEMGWSTCTVDHPLGCVTPQTQADYLTRAYKLIEQDEYVQVAIWYSLRNIGPDGPSWLDQLGLHAADFTPKPAAAAFRAYQPPAPPPGEEPLPGAPPPAPGGPGDSARALTTTILRVHRVSRRHEAHALRRRRVRLSGRVRGATAGAVIVSIRRRGADGVYRLAKRVRVRLPRDGRFSRRVRLARGRRWRARASFAGTPRAAPSSSLTVAFRTRR
jgi:hypothetical protein